MPRQTDPLKKFLADKMYLDAVRGHFDDEMIEEVDVQRVDDLNVLLRVTTYKPTGPYRTRKRDFTIKISEMY